MRTIEKTIFRFSELPESAKARALDKMAQWPDNFAWSAESLESIRAFCEQFGVTLKSWNVGPWCPYDFQTDAINANFRGLRLRDVKRENYPTGYCLDASLSIAFYDEFKRTGDALHAFNHALECGFSEWRADWEHAYSAESLGEMAEINEWEFDENGEMQ